MVMPKRDINARALAKDWQGRFHNFLVHNRLAPEGKAKYLIGWVERFFQTADEPGAYALIRFYPQDAKLEPVGESQ